MSIIVGVRLIGVNPTMMMINITGLASSKVSLNLTHPSDTESNRVAMDAKRVCENASARIVRIVVSSSWGDKLVNWYTSVARKYT